MGDQLKDTQDWIKQRNAALKAKAGGSPSSPAFAQDAADQLLAGARGAGDAFTMGLGDRAYAGARALGDAFNGADLGQAYAKRMDIEHARDAYDSNHYGAARLTGQVLGAGAQIAALGPTEGLLAGGVRMAKATPLLVREIAAVGGAGGASGFGGQVISDIANNRLSSFGDYAGSTAGGAFGTIGGLLGRHWSEILPNKSPDMVSKEGVGELFSRARTASRGDTTLNAPKSRQPLDQGHYTYPDQRSFRNGQASEIIESKFGRTAKLSPRQREAYQQLPNYRVDHTLPKDIGALFAAPLWTMSSQLDQSRQ